MQTTQPNSSPASSIVKGQQQYITALETALTEIVAAQQSGDPELLKAAIDRGEFLLNHN